jgi:hypothetical protein
MTVETGFYEVLVSYWSVTGAKSLDVAYTELVLDKITFNGVPGTYPFFKHWYISKVLFALSSSLQ